VRIKMDGKGRLTMPKALRERLDLHPGDTLEVEVRGNALRLTRSVSQPRLVYSGRVLVFTGRASIGAERMVERSRQRRVRSLIRQAMGRRA
jgi:AbrB family looped-hinge helix DNA binding protein